MKDLRDRREKTEAANCVAPGPWVLSLSDTCVSIDICREHERGAASALSVISPLSGCYFPLDGSLMTGMIGMNAGRREIRTGCTLQSAAADYTYIFP